MCCQMPLANTNGKTDWKCNISLWFQTDDFPLDPLMSGMASMWGCSQKVSVTNPVVSAELRGRAARGVGRRLSALPGALPEGESPLPSRSPAQGAPLEAERGGGGTRPRPFLSLPAPQPRGCSRRRHGQCPRRAELAVPALGDAWGVRAGRSPPGACGGASGGRERRRGAAGGRRAGAPRMSPLFSWVAKVGGAAPSALGK